MSEPTRCKCGHKKSDHGKEKCVFLDCKCRKFEVETISTSKVEESMAKFEINPEMLKKSLSGMSGKTRRSQKKPSKDWDERDKFFKDLESLDDTTAKIEKLDHKLKENPTDTTLWMKKGQYQIDAELYPNAKHSFEMVLMFDDKNIQALTKEAECLHRMKQVQAAITCLENALNIDEDNVDVLCDMIYEQQEIDEFNKSIDYAKKVLSIDERNIFALDCLGFAHKKLALEGIDEEKNYNDGLEYLKRSERIEKPDDDVYAKQQMAEIYWMQDKNDEALQLIDKLIDHKHTNGFMYYMKGRIKTDNKEYEDAIPFFKESVKLGHKNAIGHLGFCYQRSGKFDLAIIYYEEFTKKMSELGWDENTKAIYLSNLGMCYYEFKRFEEALKCFNDSLSFDGDYTKAHYWKIRTFEAMEEYEKVVQNCTDLDYLKDDPLLDSFLIVKINTLRRLKRFDELLATLDQSIQLAEKSPDPDPEGLAYDYGMKGWTLEKLDRLPDAIECYDTAIKNWPDEAEPHRLKAHALFENQEYEKSIKCFQDAWNLSKDDYALMFKGRAIKKLGNKEESHEKQKEAEEIFDMIKDNEKNEPSIISSAWREKGNCNWNLHKIDKATECYFKAVEIDPTEADNWMQLGDISSKYEAILFYDKALSLESDNFWAHLGKADTYRKLNQYGDSIKSCEDALAIDPDRGFPLYKMGSAYFLMKEYEKAIDVFSKFIDKFDSNTSPDKEDYKLGTIGTAFATKTECLRELGRFPESLESAENGLKFMSSLPDTEYNIEQKGFLLQEKGLTLMKMDDYKAAKTCFEEVLKTESEYVVFFFRRIIECCKKLGDSECLKDYEQKLKDATDSDEKS